MGRTQRRRRRLRRTLIRDLTVHDLYSWIVGQGFRSSKCDLRLAITSSGRGMVCQNAVCPGDVIIDLPECLLITASKVRSLIPNLPHAFSVEEILTAFVIIESRRGSCSSWQPYISSLPKEFSSPCSYLQIDRLPRRLQRALDRWRDIASRSWRSLSNYFQSLGVADHLSKCEFSWSWCAVNTRCIFVEGHGSALAPFLDMLNHHWTAGTNTQFKDGHFVISSNCAYDPGSEVFISYGSLDNRKLLQNYGFVLDGNPNDCVPIERHHLDSLHELKQFCRFDEKIQLIEESQLLTDQTGFTADGITWNLRVALNILQDCTPSDVTHWKLHLVQSYEESRVLQLESLLAKIVLDDYPSDMLDYTLNQLVQIEKQILYRSLDMNR